MSAPLAEQEDSMGWLREVRSGGDGGFGPTPMPAALQRLRAHWDDLRGARIMPDRTDFAPGAVADLLDICLLVERIAPGQARIRLAGMDLSDLFGMELRGMPLFTLFTPDCRTRLQPVVERVFAQPSIARLRLEAERGLFATPGLGEMLILPLRDSHGATSRALIGVTTQVTPGRSPRRFVLAGTHLEPLVPMAEATAQAPAGGPRPALRLVHSRD